MAILDATVQGLLLAHIMVFALAIAEVMRADWRILSTGRVDVKNILMTARHMKAYLAGLWITGLAIVGLTTGFEFAAIAANSKVAAKLTVVGVLTVNGFVLHARVLPHLERDGDFSRVGLHTVCAIGAISTFSWLFAAFVGSARIVAPYLDYMEFMALYLTGLAVAVLVSRLIVPQCLGQFTDSAGIKQGG